MPPPDRIVVRVSGDLAPMVPEYLEITAREFAQAIEAFAAGDFRTVRTFGHNLKGSGSSFGLEPLTQFGQAIETAAGEESGEKVQARLEEVRDFLERVTIEPE